MIFKDFSALKSSGFAAKVCIIGSGPAGLSLALQLERHKMPCLVLEAGGFEYSAADQDAYRGEVVGDSYFDLSIARLRYFGGTSGHWAGWCRPLGATTFELRRGVPHSGWPIRKAHLDPYVKQADEILNLAPLPADVPLSKDLREIHFQFSNPVTRFGEKYRAHIERSSSIGLLCNSPVVDIVPVGSRIDHVLVKRAASEPAQKISASTFCLCTGGIENSRLLLWANQLHQGGVVPKAQALGRYWMEHPIFGVGEAILESFTRMRVEGGMRFYAPSDSYLRQQGGGNFGLRLLVGQNLAKALIKDGLCYAPEIFSEYASKLDAGLVCGARLHLAWEQVPDANNRIELDSKLDATGVARSKLYWRKSVADRRVASTAITLFSQWLARSNLGRVKVAPWLAQGLDFPLDDERAGFHHMGGTRMASSPAEGVVNSDCRVFDVENLYMGGSSVFPTVGQANPTYTIVQMALRLGDHLAN
jgi:choline dehydrogenase-like flavoprotein